MIVTRHFDFRAGLQTTALTQGAGAAAFQTFQNARVDKGAAIRRPGMRRVARVTPTVYCGDFDGVDDSVSIAHDSRVWSLSSMAEWTIGGLCKPTSYAATRGVLCRFTATANDVDVNVYMDSTSSGRIVADLKDDAGATTSLAVTGIAAGTLTAWMLTKATTGTYTLYANGSSSSGTLGSGTLKVNTTDPLRIGRKPGAGTFFLGGIDFVRLHSVCLTSQRDGWRRLTNPYARTVLADYCVEKDANGDVPDRSLFGITATVQGALATTLASLAVNPAPIQGMAGDVSKDNARIVRFVAGGRIYEGTAT